MLHDFLERFCEETILACAASAVPQSDLPNNDSERKAVQNEAWLCNRDRREPAGSSGPTNACDNRLIRLLPASNHLFLRERKFWSAEIASGERMRSPKK